MHALVYVGVATAKLFVEEGAYVFITGRRQPEMDKAKAEIGRNVSTVQGDVTNLEDLDRHQAEFLSILDGFYFLTIIAVLGGVIALWQKEIN